MQVTCGRHQQGSRGLANPEFLGEFRVVGDIDFVMRNYGCGLRDLAKNFSHCCAVGAIGTRKLKEGEGCRGVDQLERNISGEGRARMAGHTPLNAFPP